MTDLNDAYRRISFAADQLANCDGTQKSAERAKLQQLAEYLVDAAHIASDQEKTDLLLDSGVAAYRAGYYARALQLIHQRNLLLTHGASQLEGMLDSFISKDFQRLDAQIEAILASSEFSDEGIVIALQQRRQIYLEYGLEDGGMLHAINRVAADCLQQVLYFARTGRNLNVEHIYDQLARCERIAIAINQSSWGWRINCLRWLIEEFAANSLWTLLASWQAPELPDDNFVCQYIRAHYERDSPVIELWASQICALPYVNDSLRKSFVLSMPTNSGKTRIAELLILRFLLDTETEPDTKAVYIAPLRRLAAEVQDALSIAFRHILNRPESISHFYGGFEVDPLDKSAVSAARILVCTPEKLDGLLRQNPELRQKIKLVIADEGHIIGDDDERGWRYRMLIERLIRMLKTHAPYDARRGARLCLLSGVLPNADNFAMWISGDAAAVAKTIWSASNRPVFKTMIWNDATKQLTNAETGNPIPLPHMPSQDGTSENNSPRTLEHAVARCAIQFARQDYTMIFSANKTRLKGEVLLDPLLNDLRHHPQFEPWTVPDLLRRRHDTEHERVCDLLVQGVALHHADLPARLKHYIENEYIAGGHAKLVLATPTLMQGVNIPVSILIILEMSHQGNVRLDATGALTPAKFQNLVGRVGRAGVPRQEISVYPTVWFVVNKTNPRVASATLKLRDALLRSYDGYVVKSAFIRHLVEIKADWQAHTDNPDVAGLMTCLAEHKLEWLTDTKQRDDIDHVLRQVDNHLDTLRIEGQASEVDIVDWLQTNLSQILGLFVGAADVSPGDFEYVKLLLQARGTYIRRTPNNERVRRYMLGLPIQDCERIEAARDELLEWYSDCVGIFAGDIQNGIQSLCHLIAFASQLSVVPKRWRPKAKMSKKPKYAGQQQGLPLDDYPSLSGDPFDVLCITWMRGDAETEVALAFEKVFGDEANFDAYLEHVFGHAIPWALSAICRYLSDLASERNLRLSRDLEFLPTLVKTGVPTIASALIVQDGFSRAGAMKLAAVIVLYEAGNDSLNGTPIVSRVHVATLLSKIAESVANTIELDFIDANRLSVRRRKWQWRST